uniref:Uncharacterized protein n=1 Tax=Plectus sambesii TaxID=2011161 RepID=A0A914WAA9_9BILA
MAPPFVALMLKHEARTNVNNANPVCEWPCLNERQSRRDADRMSRSPSDFISPLERNVCNALWDSKFEDDRAIFWIRRGQLPLHTNAMSSSRGEMMGDRSGDGTTKSPLDAGWSDGDGSRALILRSSCSGRSCPRRALRIARRCVPSRAADRHFSPTDRPGEKRRPIDAAAASSDLQGPIDSPLTVRASVVGVGAHQGARSRCRLRSAEPSPSRPVVSVGARDRHRSASLYNLSDARPLAD